MCYVGTRNVVPGACIQSLVGWRVVKDFVKGCIAVVKKAKKMLELGSGGLEYFLSREEVSPKEYVVHQWFHLMEGEYPPDGSSEGS